MARADILAMTLLGHFFPLAQRFTVKQVPTFPTVGNTGWSIQLKGEQSFHLIPAEQVICFMVSKNYDMVSQSRYFTALPIDGLLEVHVTHQNPIHLSDGSTMLYGLNNTFN